MQGSLIISLQAKTPFTKSNNKNVTRSLALPSTTCSQINTAAYQKPATQSSTYVGREASYAVDGWSNGRVGQDEVTCTNKEPDPWWEVDLQSDYIAESVEWFTSKRSVGVMSSCQ